MSDWEEFHRSRPVQQRVAADDAYTAWFNAQRQCTEALRAWSASAPDDRAAAYRAYRMALHLEEIAAGELEREHAVRLAA
jgi:hypothetical protein